MHPKPPHRTATATYPPHAPPNHPRKHDRQKAQPAPGAWSPHSTPESVRPNGSPQRQNSNGSSCRQQNLVCPAEQYRPTTASGSRAPDPPEQSAHQRNQRPSNAPTPPTAHRRPDSRWKPSPASRSTMRQTKRPRSRRRKGPPRCCEPTRHPFHPTHPPGTPPRSQPHHAEKHAWGSSARRAAQTQYRNTSRYPRGPRTRPPQQGLDPKTGGSPHAPHSPGPPRG